MIPLQTTSDCNSEMPMVPVCHGNLQYLARNPRSRLRCDPRALVAEWARGRPCAASGSGADGSRQFRINSRAAGSRATRSSRPATGFGYAAAAPPAQRAAREQTATPENTLAAARAAEKRRAERRQLWAEKRRQRQQQELRAVEQKVREDTEPRQFAAEPVRMQTPQFRLFGSE